MSPAPAASIGVRRAVDPRIPRDLEPGKAEAGPIRLISHRFPCSPEFSGPTRATEVGHGDDRAGHSGAGRGSGSAGLPGKHRARPGSRLRRPRDDDPRRAASRRMDEPPSGRLGSDANALRAARHRDRGDVGGGRARGPRAGIRSRRSGARANDHPRERAPHESHSDGDRHPGAMQDQREHREQRRDVEHRRRAGEARALHSLQGRHGDGSLHRREHRRDPRSDPRVTARCRSARCRSTRRFKT